jgi:alkanesulfonate monooxygenase SsuD/methylene tetrahydromethanopterin reductase-like flavin-dependent oxidoreductase (luciferase family)
VSVADAPAKIAKVKDYARAAGRNPDTLQFSISPGMGASLAHDDLKRAQDAGIHQLIVGSFPADLQAVKDDISRLAEKIVVPAANL